MRTSQCSVVYASSSTSNSKSLFPISAPRTLSYPGGFPPENNVVFLKKIAKLIGFSCHLQCKPVQIGNNTSCTSNNSIRWANLLYPHETLLQVSSNPILLYVHLFQCYHLKFCLKTKKLHIFSNNTHQFAPSTRTY